MKYLFLILMLRISLICSSQILISLPEASKYSEVHQTIGFTEIGIEYSRPNINGRTIFGTMLPYGSVWRTGANANTKIELSEDVFFGNKRVKKGKYALYTIPELDQWTIILNADTTLWGHYGYKDSLDVVRFKVSPLRNSHFVESFSISFQNLSQKGGMLVLEWDTLKVPIPIRIDWGSQDKMMLTKIDSVLALPDDREDPMFVSHDYLHAAMYYHNNNHDPNKALEWVNKAVSIKLVSYFPYYKAEILAKMKRYDEAISASELGLSIFMKSGSNKEWIWRYQQQIKNWKRLKKG